MVVRQLNVGRVYSCRHGKTKQPETNTSGHQDVYIIFSDIPSVLTVDASRESRRWTFLASIHVSLQHAKQSFYEGRCRDAYVETNLPWYK